MVRERHLKSIDISNKPELLRIVEEVQESHESRLLKRDDEEMAIISPTEPAGKRVARGKPFTKDDSIWNLKGIGRSGVSDVSENKYEYLAETYEDTHEK